MLQEFFINIVEDYKTNTESDELKKAIKEAYERTLLPFHGWLLQQTFSVSLVSSSCTMNIVLTVQFATELAKVQLILCIECPRFQLIN